MRLDSAAGDWSPADFGQSDRRRFPKHSRGELVRGPSYTALSGKERDFEVKIENVEVVGAFTEDPDHSTDQPNTIGILVEFVNRSKDADAWIYSPCLARSPVALNRLREARPLPTYYRGIPRTVQKLWRGEPLHILVIGRASTGAAPTRPNTSTTRTRSPPLSSSRSPAPCSRAKWWGTRSGMTTSPGGSTTSCTAGGCGEP